MAVNLKIAYNLKQCEDWPTIQRGQTIPKHLWSASPLGKVPQRRTAVGFVRAAAILLNGTARVATEDGDISIAYDSSAAGASRRVITCYRTPGTPTRWSWAGAEGASGAALIVITQAALQGEHPEVAAAWKRLITEASSHHHLPATPSQIRQLAHASDEANDAMLQLSDAIYFAIKEADEADRIDILHTEHHREFDHDVLNQVLNPNQATAAEAFQTHAPAALARLTTTGGTALLIGPTGTFKTEHAKRAAIDATARLHVLKGRPGIEDRDFYGGVYPSEHGPQWVDGPLTKAYRSAQTTKTVLVIDELLRFEPIYLGALIGALDTYTPDETRLIGGQPQGEGRHYHLQLPNGDGITAPAKNLTIIATTNIGNGYVQFQELDEALLGRFQLILDYAQAPTEETHPVYLDAAGDPHLAQAAAELERITREHHVGEEGLLARPANPRVILNLIHETRRRTNAGEPLEGAFAGAVEATVIPYCSPRDSTGRLETSTVAMLQHETKRIAKALA